MKIAADCTQSYDPHFDCRSFISPRGVVRLMGVDGVVRVYEEGGLNFKASDRRDMVAQLSRWIYVEAA